MRLNSLHNALYVAAKLLRAELVAVKLLSAQHADWLPADIAVGETSRLTQFGWTDGATEPEPRNCLRHHQPLFGVPDALSVYSKPDSCSVAIAVTVNETVLEAMPGQFLSHERRGTKPMTLGRLWFAIALEETSPSAAALLSPEGASELLELILGVCAQSLWGIYRSAMLSRDSLTELPGPAELRHRIQLNLASLKPLNEELKQAASATVNSHRTLLVLFEIDDFSLLRRQLGSDKTGELLKELAAALTQSIRKNDGLFRYSDSVFAITANFTANVADDSGKGNGAQVLEKLQSAWLGLAGEDRYAGITPSVGYNMAGQHSVLPSAAHFLLATEQALAAARESGGNKTLEASEELQLQSDNHGKHAGGIFTSDPIKDYRNNRILWQTTSLIAGETNPGSLCSSFVELLRDVLSIRQADIFVEHNGLLQSQTQRQAYGTKSSLAPAYQQCVEDCLKHKSPQQFAQPVENHRDATAVAIPLISRNQSVGALLIEADHSFDDSDLLFLEAIADQIAGALDRLDLAARQELLSARESASLRAEIQDLKESASLNSDPSNAPALIAVSQSMRDVLAYVEKVAPTDASVLIMGESGAGKEVMAKAVVAASNRADAPLITVDCSAIAHSLIDSELFGRVKGAFTGADDASPGRIAQADGGTLFLDEIGELPMDVQAKLLRFVQEKELIAVGDTRRRRIDTRIICATNRDLLFESTQGRFRSDLYYRLQVLQVTVPPLRERQADLAPLALSFAQKYSDQFGKSITGFTDPAWQKINQYSWPGNVRELQNAIVRATLTAEAHVIDAVDLQFGEELPSPEQSVFTRENQTSEAAEYRQPLRAAEHPSVASSASGETGPETDDWATLTSLLAGQVAALITESRLEAPVGRWLADTVVLTAATVSGGVARQAARLLGVPETTLRRQLTKARQNEDNPFQLMSRQWLTSLPALTDLLKTLMIQNEDSVEFSEHCQMLLLQQVANHIGDDRKAGAALMGITPPTYARWLQRFAIEPQIIEAPAAATTFKLEQKYS